MCTWPPGTVFFQTVQTVPLISEIFCHPLDGEIRWGNEIVEKRVERDKILGAREKGRELSEGDR